MMNKDQLLYAINTSYGRWQEALNKLDELAEPVLNGQSAKDLIAHVTWYEREMVAVFGSRKFEGSPLWSESLDSRNATILEQNRDRDLDDVLAESREVHARLLEVIEALDEEDLRDASRIEGMPPDWIPLDLIASNTYQHYSEHEHDLRWNGQSAGEMNSLKTKAGILAKLKQQREEWDALLARYDEAAMNEPGAMGDWPFRDLVAHLTGWRKRTAACLEAAVQGASEPAPPEWPEEFSDDTEKINPWMEERDRARPLADVLEESKQVLQRIYDAVEALPEEDLQTPGRFPWMEGEPLAMVIEYSLGHQYRDHGYDIDNWEAQQRTKV